VTPEVTIGTTHNGAALREELAASLEARGYPVTRTWFEQRSVDLGDVITVVLFWKMIGTVTDELLREAVRESVATIRRARRDRRIQAIVELPGSNPVEYWLGEHVPNEALDEIESDAAEARPGQSRHWDQDGKRWMSMDELMGE
jgi:hypothetical protein